MVTNRNRALFALATLALAGIVLPGCGGQSDDTTPDTATTGAKSDKNASTSPAPVTSGVSTTPGASSNAPGSLANPQPPEGATK